MGKWIIIIAGLFILLSLICVNSMAEPVGRQMNLPVRVIEADAPEEHVSQIALDVERTALILIDVWRSYEANPRDEWLKAMQVNIDQKIPPLLALVRAYGIAVIHAPHRHEIAEEATPLPGEFVCDPKDLNDGYEVLVQHLREQDISTLLYAGYTANLCILYRPVGMLAMRNAGYKTILLRDCSILFPPSMELEEDESRIAKLHDIERLWGITTTSKDLCDALEGVVDDSKVTYARMKIRSAN